MLSSVIWYCNGVEIMASNNYNVDLYINSERLTGYYQGYPVYVSLSREFARHIQFCETGEVFLSGIIGQYGYCHVPVIVRIDTEQKQITGVI